MDKVENIVRHAEVSEKAIERYLCRKVSKAQAVRIKQLAGMRRGVYLRSAGQGNGRQGIQVPGAESVQNSVEAAGLGTHGRQQARR